MKQFILYLLFCVIVATSTAGITVIVGQKDIKKNLGGETGTESGGTEEAPLTDEEKAMSALVASGTKLIANGINANIDAKVEQGGVITPAQIHLKAKINMDSLALSSFALGGETMLGGEKVQFNAIYQDLNVYVDVFGKKYKMTVRSLGTAISVITDLIGVDIQSSGIMPSIDTSKLNELLSNITYKENEDKSIAIGFDLALSSIIQSDVVIPVSITVDGDGDISKISVKNIDIKGSKISLNAEFLKGDFNIKVENKKEYESLDFAPELISSAINTANLKSFNLSGNLSIKGTDIQISSLLVDVSAMSVKADITVKGINVQLTYFDGTAYVDVFGKKFKVTDENLLKTIDTVLKLINVQIPSIDTDSIKIGIAEIEKILAQVEDISYVITENGLEITLKAFGADVVLTTANGYISNISFNYDGITAGISLNNPGESVVILRPDGNYMDFNFAPRLIEAVSKIMNDRKFELQANITLEGGKNQVLGLNFDIFDFKLDISDFNNIKMNGLLNVTGDFALAGSLAFNNNIVLIDYDGFRAKMNVSAIMELLKLFGVQTGSQNVIMPQLDMQTIVKMFGYIMDITYNQNTIGLILDGALFGTSGEIRLELILDENNNITNIIANDILSSIDGSRVSFNIKLIAHGESVSITMPNEQIYMDFNCMPEVVGAFLKTAELPAFDITSNFVVNQGGAPHLTANPQIVIDRANGLRVGGTVNVDLIDPSAVDYNAALWYESEWLYAKINQTAIQLNVNSIGEILSSVMSLMGQDMGSITGVLDRISSLDLEKVTKMVKSIDFIKGESANTVMIILDASVLYEQFNMQTGTMSPDVVIELDINGEGYFSRLKVVNVISALDQNVDFEILLSNIGKNVGDGEDDIKMPSRDGISFIDISGIATLITAVEKTGQRSFYKIGGKLSATTKLIPIGINRTIKLEINRMTDNSIKIALTSSYESGLIWKTQHENTLYFTPGGNFYYRLWEKTNKGVVSIDYKTVTPSEFSDNPMKYIDLLLETGILETFAGSIGGNTIDWFNVLKGMKIVDLDGGSKRVVTTLNIQELAGTTALSGMDLNIEINGNDEIYKLYISKLDIVGIAEATIDLSLDLGVTEGDAFIDFDISQYPQR